VDHLFGHLHDPEGLRCNPLVGPFFGKVGEARCSSQRDLTAVEYVHYLILRAAEFHRDNVPSGARRERAGRQFAIIMDSCFGRKTPPAIASSLGISLPQFYRERAEILSLVAEHVEFVASRMLHAHLNLDDADRRLERAVQQAEAGDREGAIREYEEIAHAAKKLIERAALVQAQASLEAMAIFLRTESSKQPF